MENKAKPDFQRRSLTASKWASLAMAVAGIITAWLSRSDALMLDGLFSGLGFFSAIIAIRVSESVTRAPDRRRPFGYDADEPIYITFRSLVLLGIIAFAGFTAIEKLLAYVGGEEIETLVLGPILVYSVAMALLAFGLAGYHRFNMRQLSGPSPMLDSEYRGALIDGGLTIGAGAALLGAPLLNGTALEMVVPVADSIVVLAMTLFFIADPIRIFRTALGEIAGEAASDDELARLRNLVESLFADDPVAVLETTLSRMGRMQLVVAYVKPDRPIDGEDVDALRDRLAEKCETEFGPTRVEILIGARPAF